MGHPHEFTIIRGGRKPVEPPSVKPMMHFSVCEQNADGTSSEKFFVRIQIAVETPEGPMGMCAYLDKLCKSDNPPREITLGEKKFVFVEGDYEQNWDTIDKIMQEFERSLKNEIGEDKVRRLKGPDWNR